MTFEIVTLEIVAFEIETLEIAGSYTDVFRVEALYALFMLTT